MKLFRAIVMAIFLPFIMLVFVFLLGSFSSMENDAAVAMMMSAFFFGVPIIALIGFIIGWKKGNV